MKNPRFFYQNKKPKADDAFAQVHDKAQTKDAAQPSQFLLFPAQGIILKPNFQSEIIKT